MDGFKKGAQTDPGLSRLGKVLGFAKGGQAKNTSGEFVMKTKGMDSMDDGVQPARKGRNQQEVEAGGTKRMTPGYKEGGYVKCKKGGMTAYKKGGKYYMMKGGKMCPYMKGGRVASAAHKTHSMPDKSQGEGVQPSGRGAKNVGKGGKTGMHKSGRITKKG